MQKISHSRLLELLDYDQETGIFTWKNRSGCCSKGGRAGSIYKKSYLRIAVDGRGYKAHRLAWFYVHHVFPDGAIDHRDGNPSNNAISNLRIATPAQNRQNLHKAKSNNKSGKIGVSSRYGRFFARISIDGTQKTIGVFDSPQKAHEAYLTQKRQFHEFCAI